MTGPTFKFWTWTAEDWPYGLVIIICLLLALSTPIIALRLLTDL